MLTLCALQMLVLLLLLLLFLLYVGDHDELMRAMNDFVRDYIRQTPFISVTSPRAVDPVVPTRTTNCYG